MHMCCTLCQAPPVVHSPLPSLPAQCAPGQGLAGGRYLPAAHHAAGLHRLCVRLQQLTDKDRIKSTDLPTHMQHSVAQPSATGCCQQLTRLQGQSQVACSVVQQSVLTRQGLQLFSSTSCELTTAAQLVPAPAEVLPAGCHLNQSQLSSNLAQRAELPGGFCCRG